MALLQDLTRQLRDDIDLMVNNKQINALLISAEKMSGFQRKQLIVCTFGILIVYLLYGWNRDLVCNAIGILLPAYASLWTIGVSKRTNETKWTIYWIVYVLFNFFEYFDYGFHEHSRFYWLGKFSLLLWFMIPGSLGGTHVVYYQIIRRFLLGTPSKKTNFYNPMAGQSNIKDAQAYDKYGNPTDSEYDLGRDSAFTGYRILIGQFYTSGDMHAPIEALKMKGFHVDNVKNEVDFISKLRSNSYQIAWVISSSSIENGSFISTLIDFHSAGGAIFLFADNIPYICHASEFLSRKYGIILTGNYPGNKTLVFRENGHSHAGYFGQHEIFTGIKNLFEGVTICHPVNLKPTKGTPMITVATATDGNPCIVVFDPPIDSAEGRLCLDCGFTKLFINWNSPGTARFIVNVSCWLAKAKK